VVVVILAFAATWAARYFYALFFSRAGGDLDG